MKKDTYSYKGWLISDSFSKRCIAVFGYAVIGQLLLATAVLIFVLVVGGIVDSIG